MRQFVRYSHRKIGLAYRSTAALLLCCLLGAGMPPALAELRYQTVAGHEGVPLNVVSAGDPANPTLLLVHGIGQSHVSFEEQLRAPVTDEFHVVAFDLRGHGNSGKPWEAAAYTDSRAWAGDVQSIIDALALDRPVLLGWSYGTLVVADYVRHFGTEQISGIVLTGAYGGMTPPPPPPEAEMVELFERNRALQLSANPADNAMAARTTAGMLTSADMGDAWRERAAQIAMMLPAYAREHMVSRSFANIDVVPKLAVPIMLVIGGRDGSTPEDQGRAFAATLEAQGTRVVLSLYPDAGHSPFAEDPARFNEELADFFGELPQP